MEEGRTSDEVVVSGVDGRYGGQSLEARIFGDDGIMVWNCMGSVSVLALVVVGLRGYIKGLGFCAQSWFRSDSCRWAAAVGE